MVQVQNRYAGNGHLSLARHEAIVSASGPFCSDLPRVRQLIGATRDPATGPSAGAHDAPRAASSAIPVTPCAPLVFGFLARGRARRSRWRSLVRPRLARAAGDYAAPAGAAWRGSRRLRL